MLGVNDLLFLLKLQQLEKSIDIWQPSVGDKVDSQFSAILDDSIQQLLEQNQPIIESVNDNSAQIDNSTLSKPNLPGEFNELIDQASNKYNIPVDLLKGVIQAESGFNPKARSSAGAQGLMQLMPTTADSLGVKNPFDPAQNIDGGARYLRKMLDMFGNDPKLALAAYNAGPGNVKKYGGIPPFKETQIYVKKITNALDTLA